MADSKGIKIRFEADDSKLNSALRNIENESKKLTKQLKEIDRLLELDPTNTTLLAQKQQLLAKSVENTSQKLAAMEKAQEKVTSGYRNWEKNKSELEANADAITALKQKYAGLVEKSVEAKKAFEAGLIPKESLHDAQKACGAVVNEIKAIKEEQKKLEGTTGLVNYDMYQRYLTDTEALRISLQQLQRQQEQVNSVLNGSDAATKAASRAEQEAARAAEAQAQADLERKRAAEQAAQADKAAKNAALEYKAALGKLKSAANDVKNDIKSMATAVSTGVGVIGSAVTAGTVATAKVGMEFSKSMSNVEALSGATAKELEQLKSAAADAGALTSKSASQAADALGYMSLAGWNTTQMLEGLMPVLRASEAGAMDLANCSDLVTDSMSAMGIAVSELQHYLDVVTKTQSEANTSMEELLNAYVVCGGTLKNLNIPLEESATILGTLANRGIKGAEAGTALNSILVNLIGANKNSASAMKDMGVSAFDAEGRFIGLTNTLKLVNSKLAEYGDNTEKISQLEAKLGGKTQLDTLQALLAGVNDEYDSLNTKITDCNGALEKTARTMQDNLSGDIITLKSSLEGVQNTIYDSLEDPFRKAAQNITQDLRDLNKACTEGELADSIKKTAESLSSFISKVSKFATDDAFPTLIKWLDWVATNSDAIIAAIKGMGAAWGLWKIGQYASHLQKLVEAIKLVRTASIAATAAQTGLTVSAETAAASQEALAAATQLTASAFLMLEVAIGAVLIAITAYVAKKIDAAAEELRNRNALDETTQALRDQAEAYKAASEAAEENCANADKNAEVTRSYWQEVQSLVDETGRATGSTDELRRAVYKLNEMAGTNIEVVNGQIQGYKDLVSTMDDYIERTRREAKMSYLKEGYGEAVANIDSVTEQYQKAYAERMVAYAQYNKKLEQLRQAEATGYSKDLPYDQLLAETEAAQDRLAKAQVNLNSYQDLMNSYQQTINEYEGLLSSDANNASKTKEDAIREAATIDAKAIEEQNRKNAELAKRGVKKTWEELEAELSDLDANLSIHSITEEEYWDKRRSLLEESQYKESAEWWKYYDQVTEHYDKLSETEKKAQEQALKEQQDALADSIDEQISAVKLRQELDNSYTKSMMYNDMETIISGLDKESELYKKYNSEILKGRKSLADEASKATADGYKTEIGQIENQIKEVTSAYQNAMKDLLSKRDAYFNKLFDTSKFTFTSTQKDKNGQDTEIFGLADPEAAYRDLVAFEKKTEALRAKGVSENVLAWIDSLDAQTAADTMDVLNRMSDSKLKAYSASFDKYKNKAESMADNKYADQIEALNKGFVEEVDALIAQLPGKAEVNGQETVAGFIKGLQNKNSDLTAAVNEFTGKFIEQIKSNLNINSPSKETEGLGEYSADGFIKGFENEDMSSAVEKFTSSFIAKLAQKDPDIRAAMEEVFTGNLSAVLSNMEALTDVSMGRISSILSDKLPKLPDVTKLTLPTTESVYNASSGADLSAIIEKLGKLDTLIALLQEASNDSTERLIRLQLELEGRLEADTDTIAAVIRQKFDNIAIQTGKQVFKL